MPEDISYYFDYYGSIMRNENEKPVISAHRGAADLAPENTFPAIGKALDLGAGQIEIDVRASRDGVLYDLHDSRVDRTTDGKGYISLMKSTGIDKLKIGYFTGCRDQGYTVPRVEEILKRFGGRARFYFDVKPGVKLESLLSLVYKYGLEEHSLFWFKDMAQASKLKNADPGLALKINVSGPEDMLERTQAIPFDVIEIDPEIFSESLRQLCLSRDIAIMVNFIGKEDHFAENPGKWPVEYVNVHRIAPLIPYLEKQRKKEFTLV